MKPPIETQSLIGANALRASRASLRVLRADARVRGDRHAELAANHALDALAGVDGETTEATLLEQRVEQCLRYCRFLMAHGRLNDGTPCTNASAIVGAAWVEGTLIGRHDDDLERVYYDVGCDCEHCRGVRRRQERS